jgi:hypothetical protein
MPKAANKELSDGATFLGRAMALHDLVTNLGDTSKSAPMTKTLEQVRKDLATFADRAQGNIPGFPQATFEVPNPNYTKEQIDQMQDAAWFQSGAAQAEMVLVQMWSRLSSAQIKAEVQKVRADVLGDATGTHLDQVVTDLAVLQKDFKAATAQISALLAIRAADGSELDPKSCAGALRVYVGPLFEQINDLTSSLDAFLDPSAVYQLNRDLAVVSRGHELLGKDGSSGTCLEAR